MDLFRLWNDEGIKWILLNCFRDVVDEYEKQGTLGSLESLCRGKYAQENQLKNDIGNVLLP